MPTLAVLRRFASRANLLRFASRAVFLSAVSLLTAAFVLGCTGESPTDSQDVVTQLGQLNSGKQSGLPLALNKQVSDALSKLALAPAPPPKKAVYAITNQPDLTQLPEDVSVVFLHPRAIFNRFVNPTADPHLAGRQTVLYHGFMDLPHDPESQWEWVRIVSMWLDQVDGYARTAKGEYAVRWPGSPHRYHIDPTKLDPAEFAGLIYAFYNASGCNHILLDMMEPFPPHTPPGFDPPTWVDAPDAASLFDAFRLEVVATLRERMGANHAGRWILLNGLMAEQAPSFIGPTLAQGVLWEQFGLYYGGLIPACQRLSNFEYSTRIAPQHFLLQGDQQAAQYIAAATGSWTASWWLAEKTWSAPTPVQ